MKTFPLLISCLLLIGCTHQDAAPRWAVANKSQIDTAIYVWSRDKASESLTPEEQEQIRQYEALQNELTRKQVESRMRNMSLRTPDSPTPTTPASDSELDALSKRVADAKAPIADLADRRARKMEEYRNQFSTEKLIAEFAKGHFDLVVDSGQISSHSVALYNKTGEVLDITDGILNLLKEKTKP